MTQASVGITFPAGEPLAIVKTMVVLISAPAEGEAAAAGEEKK